MLILALLILLTPVAASPPSMRAVVASGFGACTNPYVDCVSVQAVATPKPNIYQVLIKVNSSSVNPVTIDWIEKPHPRGLLGTDVAGVVVAVGSNSMCDHLKVGDAVWTQTLQGAYAEYVVATCLATGLAPKSMSLQEAGTLPCVGVTTLQCLVRTGQDSLTPWANRTNVTVVITSGQGGTGFIAIQLAKALGATSVVTAAAGDGIAFVKSLGADIVVDFTKQEIFDALPDNSVDIVYDNYGIPGTADKAMHAIRPGGVFLVMSTGEGGHISDHPKPGVTQIQWGDEWPLNRTEGLDGLASLVDAHGLQAHIEQVYRLEQVSEAFAHDKNGGVLGKLAIVPDQ